MPSDNEPLPEPMLMQLYVTDLVVFNVLYQFIQQCYIYRKQQLKINYILKNMIQLFKG